MFKKIEPKDFNRSVFSMLGEGWALLGARADNVANAMTVGWGGLGFMWGRDVSFTVVRPQRYTREFVDKAGRFSLSFPPREYREQMQYLGTVSGRDEDKLAKCGMKLSDMDGVPYFEESDAAVFCRVLYSQPMLEGCFLEKDLVEKWYPEKDFHILYVSEVEKILVRE